MSYEHDYRSRIILISIVLPLLLFVYGCGRNDSGVPASGAGRLRLGKGAAPRGPLPTDFKLKGGAKRVEGGPRVGGSVPGENAGFMGAMADAVSDRDAVGLNN